MIKKDSACRWTRDRLPLIADSETLRELDGPERNRADRHLADCPQCRDHLQRLDTAMLALQIVAETPDPDVDESSLWPLLQQRIRQSQPLPAASTSPTFEIRLSSPSEEEPQSVNSHQQARTLRQWQFAIAASLLITAVAATIYLSGFRQPFGPTAQPHRENRPAIAAEKSSKTTKPQSAAPSSPNATPAVESHRHSVASSPKRPRVQSNPAPEAATEILNIPSSEPTRIQDSQTGLSR